MKETFSPSSTATAVSKEPLCLGVSRKLVSLVLPKFYGCLVELLLKKCRILKAEKSINQLTLRIVKSATERNYEMVGGWDRGSAEKCSDGGFRQGRGAAVVA